MHRTRLGGLAVLIALVVSACTSSAPDDLVDGVYRGFASSDGDAPEATLVIEGDIVTITEDDATSVYTITAGTEQYVVCPDEVKGVPSLLDASLAVGDVALLEPAIFGDCGGVRPMRVTLMDLTSREDRLAFPFTRWVEFCDVTDDDC